MAKQSTPPAEPPAPALPRVSVLERRLQNPFGEPSAPVDLKDASLSARWFNAAIVADKIWRAKQKGWRPVRPEDLVDPDQIGGFVKSPEGFVTRGDRGQEVLMCMPKHEREQIDLAKARWNTRNMGNPNAMKREVVEAASKQLGDEPADYINRRVGIVGGVTDSYERIQSTPDVES